MNTIKLVVVGDGNVGKTSILMRFGNNTFPTNYVPTVFENYSMQVMYHDKPYTLNLFDTAGQEEYDRLRIIAYPNTNVFLICFSVMNPPSLKNVTERWHKELKENCFNTPFIVVGTKIDLRHKKQEKGLTDKHMRPVSKEKGEATAKSIQAYGYAECSALTAEGLNKVFDLAIDAALKREVKKRPICKIL